METENHEPVASGLYEGIARAACDPNQSRDRSVAARIAMLRLEERACRGYGWFDSAVFYQQLADALESHGFAALTCEANSTGNCS